MIDKVCLLCVLSTYVYHLSILYPFVLKIKYYTPSQVEWSMIQKPQATLLIQEERSIIYFLLHVTSEYLQFGRFCFLQNVLLLHTC
jgi:hypothetical protein